MTRLLGTASIAAFAVLGVSAGTAWAGGPPGQIDNYDPEDNSAAVGTGVFDDTLVGFSATGDDLNEASDAVIAACVQAGGVDCTADEATNDNLCIVSVSDDNTDVVAGGAGRDIEAARLDAIARAAANGTPLPANATPVISACPS